MELIRATYGVGSVALSQTVLSSSFLFPDICLPERDNVDPSEHLKINMLDIRKNTVTLLIMKD